MKYYPNKFIERYKARIITQSFLQIYGINFARTFGLIVRKKILKKFLAIAIMLKLTLLQINVISAYLKNCFDNKNQLIFIKILQRFRSKQERLICKILKSLYSLKQSKRLWNKTISKFFQKIRLVLTNANLCILAYK